MFIESLIISPLSVIYKATLMKKSSFLGSIDDAHRSFDGARCPAGLNYLNGDANIVVHFDSKRLQQSQTFKDLMSMAMANPKAKSNLDDMKSKTGVDVLKDIDSVTAQIKAPKHLEAKRRFLATYKVDSMPRALSAR